MRAVIFAIAGAWIGLAQTPGQQGPPPGAASVRASGGSLGRIRVGGADSKIWFGWPVTIRANVFQQLTLSEAAAKADALGLASIEGVSTQKLSAEIPKNLDFNLKPGERKAVLARFRELNLKMPVYLVPSIAGDADSRKKLFEFAKDMGVEAIVIATEPSALADLEAMANEYGVNVAIESRKDPKNLLQSLNGRGARIGIAADTGAWMQAGIKPVDGLALVKNKLLAVNLLDRSALGNGGKDVVLGNGAGAISDFLLQAFRMEVKPLYITVDASGTGDIYAELSRSIDGFEKAMRPAMQARVYQVSDLPMGAIRGPERLSAEVRKRIEDATPKQALAKPKKSRKLLVLDINMYSGHGTIPHGNLMLELMGKKTGAFEAVFSNDQNNLKYPKIKEYDAIFLNNVVGMVFQDQEVRDGIIRFVREGGGIGGLHGVTYASMDWPEFTEMLGGWAGEHHTEKQVLKIDDPESPLNAGLVAAFGTKGFEHTDEFYHFPMSSPYSRDKLHVLLSIDVDQSDMATSGRLCAKCVRSDQDYGMSWIRNYGKGRVFITPLGHTEILFTNPAWTQHMLGGIQFMLGDLEADATPSSKLKKK